MTCSCGLALQVKYIKCILCKLQLYTFIITCSGLLLVESSSVIYQVMTQLYGRTLCMGCTSCTTCLELLKSAHTRPRRSLVYIIITHKVFTDLVAAGKMVATVEAVSITASLSPASTRLSWLSILQCPSTTC